MRDRAAGVDERPVEPHREEQSISAEETFAADIRGAAALNAQLLHLADRAASRLRSGEFAAATVNVKIRRADFTTYSRQRKLGSPTRDTAIIAAAAKTLLERWLAVQPDAAIRLLGVGVSDLQIMPQRDLFDGGPAHGSRLDLAIDGIRDRFGSGMLTRASLLPANSGTVGPGG
jgi:DNA polymerase-4